MSRVARAKLIDLTAHLDFLQSPEDRGEIHALALSVVEQTVLRWPTYVSS